MMFKVLYLPSTPFNVLVSAAMANARRENDCSHLWLIDQSQTTNNPYYQALMKWPNSPFEKIMVFSGEAKGWAKFIERQDNFKEIEQGLNQFKPDVIAVGSDRRIEFQYAMHWLKKQSFLVEGWYLDDGLYSYVGRPSNLLKDGVNSWLKKIVYGLWWKEPKTVGASGWIDKTWLFRPKQAVVELLHKNNQRVEPEWFTNSNMQQLSQLVFEEVGFSYEFLSKVDYVVIVPHPNNQLKIQCYENRIKSLVSKLSAQGQKIAVKYHPRQIGEDDLDFLQDSNVSLISATLAFEFILPLLSPGATVIGDVCTALLTTKWLREDLCSIAVLNADDPFQKRFIPMFSSAGVTLLNDFKELNKIL